VNPSPVARVLLWPASFVFGLAVRLRGWLYQRGILSQKRLKGVVVSVGNLTVGGTGKTPMVLWLAERLVAEGRRVAILTRGYRGTRGKDAQANLTPPVGDVAPLASFSDEVWVYWKRLEAPRSRGSILLGVGADRWEWGQKMEKAGAEWFLLDDGFQHLRLARDVDIVLIDAAAPFDGSDLLPAGRLREPRSALARADLVVITRTDHAPAIEAVVQRHTRAPIFYAQTVLTDIRLRNPDMVGPVKAEPQKRKFFAFCGIGNPAAFFDDLRRWKIQVAGTATFRDHHRYSPEDVENLQARAQAAGAEAMLCTEKDVFNFRQVRFKRLPLFFCRIVLHVANASAFWKQVNEIVERKRGGAAP